MLDNSSHSCNVFSEVYESWDLSRLLSDLEQAQGKTISESPQKVLRGALLGNSPKDIAKKCQLADGTVRQYWSQAISPAIKMLMYIPDEERLQTIKTPYILKEYRIEQKKIPKNLKPDLEIQDIEEFQQTRFEIIDDIDVYVEIFRDLCDQEDYLKAFYKIFNPNSDECVYSFLDSAGYVEPIIELYEYLLASWNPRHSEKWEFGTAHACLANAYQRVNLYNKAIEKYEKCLEISKEIEDIQGEAGALVNLGFGNYLLQRYEEAIIFNREGLNLSRQIIDKDIEGFALNNLALIFEELGEYHLSLDYHYHALEVRKLSSDSTNVAASLINIGNNYRYLELYQNARDSLCEGIEVAGRSGYCEFEANGWYNLGLVLEELEENVDAVFAFQESCDLFKSMNFSDQVDDAITAIARIQTIEQ